MLQSRCAVGNYLAALSRVLLEPTGGAILARAGGRPDRHAHRATAARRRSHCAGGDSATAALVRQAIDRFSAWKFEAGEEILARAPEERLRHEHEPPRSPYFNTCALVLAPSG